MFRVVSVHSEIIRGLTNVIVLNLICIVNWTLGACFKKWVLFQMGNDFTPEISQPTAIISFAHALPCHLFDVYLTLHHNFAPALWPVANKQLYCRSRLWTMRISLSLHPREMNLMKTVRRKGGEKEEDHLSVSTRYLVIKYGSWSLSHSLQLI